MRLTASPRRAARATGTDLVTAMAMEIAVLEAKIATMAAKMAQLEERNEHLEFCLSEIGLEPNGLCEEFGLTRGEAKALGIMLENPGHPYRRIAMMMALYSRGAEDDWPEIKIIDVFVCKIRKKTRGRVTIKSHHSIGYSAERIG